MENTISLTEDQIKRGLSELKTSQTRVETTNEEKIKTNTESIKKLIAILESDTENRLAETKEVGVDMSYLKEMNLEDLLGDSDKLIAFKNRVLNDIAQILINSKVNK